MILINKIGISHSNPGIAENAYSFIIMANNIINIDIGLFKYKGAFRTNRTAVINNPYHINPFSQFEGSNTSQIIIGWI